MEEYLHRREQLISLDRARRIDVNPSPKDPELSRLEKDADFIFREIRALEATSIWGPESDPPASVDDPALIFPGMAFLTARDIILKSALFEMMSKMPKGALLHVHLDATVNAEVLAQLALQHPNIHMRTPERLTAKNMTSVLPEFRPLPRLEDNSVSLTTEAYQPGAWVPLSKVKQDFPQDMGGPSGFDQWLVRVMTISPLEAYKTHNTTQKIWAKFGSIFLIAHPLVYYAPIWREYIRKFFWSTIEDGIAYVEVRINFRWRHMFDENGEETIPHREWLIEYDRVMSEVTAELKAQGRGDEFIGSKIIYSTVRFITPEELEWHLEDCIALKQEFPHLIAGFDLVGHEDSLRPLIDYVEPLTQFAARVKELGLDLPFILHAGETLGDGTPADMNLYDAILLGTKRIGHGFSLIKHPELMDLCREKNIAVEVCPISNEILRLTSSMPMHPLPALMNHGVPVSLCSDDPSIFGNMGLSFDFYQVVVASEITGLITAGELARGSFKYCCLTEEEQRYATEIWDQKWHSFLEWVVNKWGPKTSLLGSSSN